MLGEPGVLRGEREAVALARLLAQAERYDVDPAKAARFGAALRRYLPDVRDEDLEPDYAGIRPKLAGPGVPFRDFVVEERPAGLINLLGIESPGLTASEAIARWVARIVG